MRRSVGEHVSVSAAAGGCVDAAEAERAAEVVVGAEASSVAGEDLQVDPDEVCDSGWLWW